MNWGRQSRSPFGDLLRRAGIGPQRQSWFDRLSGDSRPQGEPWWRRSSTAESAADSRNGRFSWSRSARPAERPQQEIGGSAIPPRKAVLAVAGLGMLSSVSMMNAMTEPNRYWRAGAAVSSGLAAIAAFFVWCFSKSDWVHVPVDLALVANVVSGGRLHMRAGGKKKMKTKRRKR